MIHSIRSKIFLAIVSITLLTALAVTVAFYFKSAQMVEDNYGKNLYGRVEQIGNSFDDALKEIYYITVQASCDEQLQAGIKSFQETGDEGVLEETAEYLKTYKRRYSQIGSIYLLLPEERVMVTSQDYPVYEKNIDKKRIQEVQAKDIEAQMPAIMEDPLRLSSKMLTYIDEIKDERGIMIGYLMVNIEERTIFYQYLDGLYEHQSSKAMILNKNHEIISSKYAEEMGSIYQNSDLEREKKNGVHNSNDKLVISVSYKAVFSGYHFLVTTQKNEILSDLNQLRYFLGALLALFLGASLIPAYVITRKMYKPLNNLTRTMGHISDGELDERVRVTTKDEIGELSQNFNHMLDHINQLIRQLLKEEMLKKDAELEALQYQITPHFMYNTLNSIKYAALIKGEEEIGNMIGDFVELLQASINKKGTFITVSDELHILEHYIRLQEIRYEGKFAANYRISPEARGCFVPRLILQPLVENALLHGLDMKNGDSSIRILGEVRSETLYLSVEDNGRGMSQDQIEKILTNKAKKTNGLSGIGVANVRERLELYYGEKGGISYESGSQGTKVSIWLPVYYEQNQYSI